MARGAFNIVSSEFDQKVLIQVAPAIGETIENWIWDCATTAQKAYRADKALVVITSTFTIPAEKLAKQVGVILWDRKQLLKKMNTSQIDLFASF